jgi:hypothetical protein
VHAVVVDPAELLGRFPEGEMTPKGMRRAVSLGVVQPTEDRRVRVADRRFLGDGSELAHLGIPVNVFLDEWEALVAHTDDIATRFTALFETYLHRPTGSAGSTPMRPVSWRTLLPVSSPPPTRCCSRRSMQASPTSAASASVG